MSGTGPVGPERPDGPGRGDEAALEVVDAAVAGRLDAPTRAVLEDAGWRRLHPVTPVLRAWKIVAAVLAFAVVQNGDELLRIDVEAWLLALVVLGGLLVLAVVGAVYSAIAWRRTRYRVDAEAVRVERGVLWRQQRSAQLDRLQAVDVVRPLLGRLFGLAELRLEVAGGSGSKVSLAYLREDEAQRVRNALLAAAAGLRLDDAGGGALSAPEAPQRPVVHVPPARLVAATLRSASTVLVLLAAVALVVGSVAARSTTPLVAALPGAVGVVSAVWQRFTRGFNFTVAESPDGMRLTHGLLELRSQTLPPGRVQALRITQPLLWRRPGWWRVQVNVAGYAAGPGEAAQEASTVLPVGTEEELARVLAIVLPALGASGPGGALDLVRDGLTGRDDDGGYTPVPRAARWLDPVSWRRGGYLVTEHAFLARGGRVVRRLDVVPHARTQSLGLAQGPLQRRLGLAGVALHSTSGPVKPRVDHLAAPVAARLLAEQSQRARAARAAAGPERWMAGGADD
ncbi:PH domain-containing protein [Kineococcus sp. SYSU DK018]|uniref:PH domain-containing protein n=1 Tax=Kineococcus sp. SYSU DK018 TaxID=3383139 RepID=UPI003D7E15F5